MLVTLDGLARNLERVTLGRKPDEDRGLREQFIQSLVHDHPALVPMAEIEPAFSPLISVCMELPTPAGPADNLWVTPWGGLVLGEAKLVRNPQARREVVAQALDYARAITNWSYLDLEDAIRKARRDPEVTLWSLVEADSDLDEAQFVDAVQRRLKRGQLLILIVGDGIQEGVEALTQHLQLHAGLHVGLALVDLSLWRQPGGELLVIPRVPMRTVLIERGIVRIETDGAAVVPPRPSLDGPRSSSDAPARVTVSEEEFLDHLTARRPDLVGPLKSTLAELANLGIRPEYGKTVKLTFQIDANRTGSIGYIGAEGKFWSQTAASTGIRLGRPDAADGYQAELARLVGGAVRRYETSPPEVMGPDGRGLDASELFKRVDDWAGAVSRFISALSQTSPDGPD